MISLENGSQDYTSFILAAEENGGIHIRTLGYATARDSQATETSLYWYDVFKMPHSGALRHRKSARMKSSWDKETNGHLPSSLLRQSSMVRSDFSLTVPLTARYNEGNASGAS